MKNHEKLEKLAKSTKVRKITTLVNAISSPVCYFFLSSVTLPILMLFMIFQLILPVLLTPNQYCFHNQVTPPPDRLGVSNQTFTKLDMVTSDFL